MYLTVNEASNGYNLSVFAKRNESTSTGHKQGQTIIAMIWIQF